MMTFNDFDVWKIRRGLPGEFHHEYYAYCEIRSQDSSDSLCRAELTQLSDRRSGHACAADHGGDPCCDHSLPSHHCCRTGGKVHEHVRARTYNFIEPIGDAYIERPDTSNGPGVFTQTTGMAQSRDQKEICLRRDCPDRGSTHSSCRARDGDAEA